MGVSYLKNSVSQSDYTYIADNRLVDNKKKTILCFLLIMITLICCIGCSQSASYKVLEAGGCDSVVNANHKAEFDRFINEINDTSVESVIKVNVNGRDFEVPYRNTYEYHYYNTDIDIYMSDDAIIGINKNTGRLDRYDLICRDPAQCIIGDKISEDAQLVIAQKYLKKHVEDFSSYQLVDTYSYELFDDVMVYDYQFTRFVNGVQTYDTANISVTNYGSVISHYFFGLGEMADAKPISDNELELIRKSVDAKLSDIYDSVKDKYSVTYEIDKPILTKIYDGSTVLEYGISVNFKSVSGTDVLKSEHLTLIVYVDD